jgi:pimeloyl-ACP methyl ester carboxylesterase
MLFFPGGHCSAAVDCGWSLYTSIGHGVLSFSRPGYGLTDVGRLNAEEFVPAVAECCEALGIDATAGAVGVSFGGMQAIHVAVALAALVPRLALHSCAPSTHANPDTRLEGLLGPIAEWWRTWSQEDRILARDLFKTMGSGAGFVYDLQQGRSDRGAYRRLFQARVRCPTLVTASRDDAGVAFGHAEDFAHTIPAATLVELDAPSHLFWIGPAHAQVQGTLSAFITATS